MIGFRSSDYLAEKNLRNLTHIFLVILSFSVFPCFVLNWILLSAISSHLFYVLHELRPPTFITEPCLFTETLLAYFHFLNNQSFLELCYLFETHTNPHGQCLLLVLMKHFWLSWETCLIFLELLFLLVSRGMFLQAESALGLTQKK